MSKEIKLGLPKGSLNTPGRGNTYEMLVNAGYDVRGYEPEKESDQSLSISNDPELIPFLARPQSAPLELNIGLLDAAITGKDWVQDTIAAGTNGIRKIGDLAYGQLRLVVAISVTSPYQSLSDFFRAQKGRQKPILCFTEYVNLTRLEFVQNEAYQEVYGNKPPMVWVRGLKSGKNRLVQIFSSDGITEGYIAKGADIVVDGTQSGSTIRKYGLRELEEVLKSSAGLYVGPGCRGLKERKAQELFERLRKSE